MSTTAEKHNVTTYRRFFTTEEVEELLLKAMEAEAKTTFRRRDAHGNWRGQNVRIERRLDKGELAVSVVVSVNNDYVETAAYNGMYDWAET